MNTTWAGGSSSVLSRALNAEFDSMCTSSMMQIRYMPRNGVNLTFSRISRTSSTPVFDAQSISMTSTEVPWAISAQAGQVLQGVPVGPFSQLSALARMRATVVLPTPRVPENKNACAIRLVEIAFTNVWTTCG